MYVGILKDKKYKTYPHTLEELNKLRSEISKISSEKLQTVNNNMFSRYVECIRSETQIFQHLLLDW
jgi:predicted component of viral defense system (DUF524 family)